MDFRICLLALSLWSFDALAATHEGYSPVQQQDTVRTVSGTVLDANTSEPLIGAVVLLKGSDKYAITDIDGAFSLELKNPGNGILEVSLLGYKTREFPASEGNLRLALAPESEQLEEVQVIAYGKQSKMSITGSIASVKTSDLLKSPSGSAAGALAGAVTGISSVQVSGQPGAEDPQIFVRGTGSLTDEASAPLILVDGVERSFFQMDPNEIESVTVLKDASSTAVFGVRGANGVILVTTRRGQEGKARLTVDSSFGLTQALRKLTGVSSHEYALLYTEAQTADGVKEKDYAFSPYITEAFRLNSDPVMYPDTDWEDYIFKDYAWQTHHNVTLSGGGKNLHYFVSLGYLHQDGMMKQYYESYDSNFLYNRFNYRANIDANLTPSTTLSVNIGGRVGITNEPQNYDIWRNLMWCVPFASPGFIDGKYITLNLDNTYIKLPGQFTDGLSLYYNWGYTRSTDNVANIDVSFDQKLDMITPGLKFTAKGSYNTDYYLTVSRTPTATDSNYTPIYMETLKGTGRDVSDVMFDNTIVYQTDGVHDMHEPMSYGEWSGKGRNWYLEGSLNYSRAFGDHEVTGLLLYNQSKTYYPSQYTDIPTAYVGYVGRATYAYKKRYMLDLNAGYNGSENFAPGKRYGFFPSGSIGWIISEEKFMKSLRFVDFLKLRASYGLVGNDKYSGARFLYLADSWLGNSSVWNQGSYQFGTGDSHTMLPDAKENTLGNQVVTWEKCAKQNYGIDLKMFDYRLSVTADLFYEHRTDILSTRNTLPSITDIKLPLINLGIVDNHGYELSVTWKDRLAREVDYTLTANMSYSKNKIVYMDEVPPNEPYMAQTGRSTGLNYGYIFDRFLQESDFDESGKILSSLPEMSLGNPKPGDVLFKDLNGDGKINGNDCTYFGYGSRPDYIFGLVGGISWRGWSFSMQWTGALHASRMLSGEYRTAFGTTNTRSLLKFLADGRYHEGNTENARFPRLTFTNKSYNELDSSLWLMDGSYLRLKTAELAYTFDGSKFLKGIGIESARVYVNGYNLLTLFSELADIDIDPEGMTGGTGASAYSYPNNKIYNIGVNLSF